MPEAPAPTAPDPSPSDPNTTAQANAAPSESAGVESKPKTTPSKKAPAKKAPARKPSARKPPARKPPVRKPPARKPPAKRKAARSRSSKTRSPARKRINFKVNDKVVHPHHGAAIITKKTEHEIAGESRSYFELQIATEQLTVFVPVDTIDQNIRPVISKTAAGKVLRIFKEEPQASGSNWSRWYKVLNEKMTSGDIHQVAEVVRDLTYAQHTKGISPALKRMLSRARVTLTSELAFAFDIDTEEATERLDNALPVPETPET